MIIGLQDVTFEFGARVIVESATWHIMPNERIGFVGYNGTGKSTILKLFAGDMSPSKGTVEKGKGVTIGYLHQDLLSFQTDDSILNITMSGFTEIKKLEKEIEEMGIALEKHSTDELLHEYADKLHQLELLDAYSLEPKAKEILQNLGFTSEQLTKPFSIFSGGWRMRVLLAKMILESPDLLLLDEPTNHLDLPSIEWLEKYLNNYKGSVVIVSHDRFFLNRMVDQIVELYQRQLHFYNGNYDFYQTEKQQRIELQQRAYENQQDYINQQERFIERFRAKATKAAAAQSAMKRLDKIERIEPIEIERPQLRIQFQLEKQPGKVLCTLESVSKSFGENTIVKNAFAEINRGDKIALIGANGKGKSTLLRIIAGTEHCDGNRKIGHNVVDSFYAQHQLEALNLNHTILEELQLCGSNKNDLELRTILGCFLFSGDDVDKKIKILSGGEKARVALAKVITSRSNFLILDEPTNHLDMVSVELLSQALQKFEGTLVFVSHDRYFISKTANQIWEIENHNIKIFKGGYDEWITWNDAKKKQEGGVKVKSSNKANFAKEETVKKPVVKVNIKDAQKLEKDFKQVESRLADVTAKKTRIEESLADPNTYNNPAKFGELEKELYKVQSEWDQANKLYEELFEKMFNQQQ